MANFSVPTTGNAYTDVVGFINNKISDLALMLDPATSSPTNVPTNSIRWSSAANRFEKWNGSAWNAASTLYAINISGNAGTATTLATPRTINGTSFNGSANITTANWGTARTITIGGTGKSVNGSAAVTWTLAELGISASMQPVVAAASLAAGQAAFGVPSTTGTGASGTWDISIGGTAANCSSTVTAAGLAVGGGALTSDIVVSVPRASIAGLLTGLDNASAVTPLGVRQAFSASGAAPVFACRAWVNFNGTGTVAIRASGNVSSITDNGVGAYTVNFNYAMPDANYSVVLTRDGNGFIRSGAFNAESVTLLTTSANSGGNIGGVPQDVGIITAAFFR